MQELSAYYGSEEWHADLAEDEAGNLPRDLKRGVLSQDGLYDLLQDADKILRHALEVLGK